MESAAKTAKLFGEYLDSDNFEAATPLLAEQCRYEIGDRVLTHRDEIIELYRSNMIEGRQKFDVLEWGKSHTVELTPTSHEVYFSDFLKHKGISHNYRCKQRLTLNEQHQIIEIEHVELPGEREKLLAFKEEVGLG